MPKRTARRIEEHKKEAAGAEKSWHYWVQQEMAAENKKNVGTARAKKGGADKWAQHSHGLGSKGTGTERFSKSTVLTPDHPDSS